MTAEGDTNIRVRCVSVRQLLEATQTHTSSVFKIDGNELEEFIVVANLCSLDAGPTSAVFELDDGTGRIRALLGNEKLDAQDNMLEAHDFPYLRVTGELKQFHGKKCIRARDIRKVSSPYEPYYHILHAIRDTLTYEHGPPPRAAVVENGDPRSHARNDTAAEGPQADTVELDTQVSPPASIVRKYKGKAPMSGQESPTPLSATSNSLPISPTHRSLVGDAGISEHGDTSRYGNQMTPISPSRDTASEVQHGSSPPSPSPVPAVVHTRRSIPNDPYSKLTSLQRDVILCLKSAEAEVPNTSSLYPTSERNPIWRGVHLSTIVNSVRRPGRRPVLFEEFEECIVGLVEREYIFSPIDDEYYRCTGTS